MQVVDLTQQYTGAPAAASGCATVAAAPTASARDAASGGDALAVAQAQVALLEARVEHLQAVLDTARGLMTSNQERLLRKLHDLPQELVLRTQQLQRMQGAGATWYEPTGARP
jgi:uncharacterized protein (DUF305 family)